MSARMARRQHYSARFYLKNFAEPLFSQNLWVYDLKARRWEPRTPYGVGWFPHLFSAFNAQGRRSDSFDKFLKEHIEDPATDAMKKAAEDPENLDPAERQVVAMFAALSAARTPTMLEPIRQGYFAGLPEEERREFDEVVKLWCKVTGVPCSESARSEVSKPSLFKVILAWTYFHQQRILGWNWTFLRTTRNLPFVTSDWPMFGDQADDGNVRLTTFPISSEVALVANSAGQLKSCRDPIEDVRMLNGRTVHNAERFVVCNQRSFPGEEFLEKTSQDD